MTIYNRDKTENFIIKAQINTNNLKYLYSKVNYIYNNVPVIIICLEHGDFEQLPKVHLRGHGCPKCYSERKRLLLFSNTEEFIIKSKPIHMKLRNIEYIYSKTIYVHCKDKVIITCPLCLKDFKQTPNDHLNWKGCPNCFGNKNKTLEEFITEANMVHIINDNILFNYEKSIYKNNHTKLIITCLKCNNGFFQTPNKHLSGQGCPRCKISKGEKDVTKYLIKNKILFNPQFSFKDCKNIYPLPFDFGILNESEKLIGLIEYQGEQHFKSVEYWGGVEGLKIRKLRDQIKLDYCTNNKIPLLRIPYWEYKKINQLIKEFINIIKKGDFGKIGFCDKYLQEVIMEKMIWHQVPQVYLISQFHCPI